jgi:hypothetical protein
MKHLLRICVLLFSFVITWQAAADVSVHGYYRRNGTYVQPYHRSAPDGTVTNNYSFRGNVNPYTGKVGANYYRHELTSPYYTGPDSHGNVGHATAYGIRESTPATGYTERRVPPSSSLCSPPYRMMAQDGCQR